MIKTANYTLVLMLTSLLFLTACKPKHANTNRAFYYWKSSFELNNKELDIIKQNNISTLYIKYFDVVWNNNLNAAYPVAKINFKQAVPAFMVMVPVVYITNTVLQKTPANDIEKLANNIYNLIHEYPWAINNKTPEIQIDCDWTLGTKEKYFKLLNTLKNKIGHKVALSATIRLHQIKYASSTGIPPVQKGMLMYYNMGNLHSTKLNSIFNEHDAEKYAPYIKQYPLALDVVLPVFKWVKVFRNHKMQQLIQHVSIEELLGSGIFKAIDKNSFRAIATSHYKGINFVNNDILVIENISAKESIQAAQHLRNYYNSASCTVALFHLKQSNLHEYTRKDFETLYTTFN
jgi:hypothetical protein